MRDKVKTTLRSSPAVSDSNVGRFRDEPCLELITQPLTVYKLRPRRTEPVLLHLGLLCLSAFDLNVLETGFSRTRDAQ